MRIREAIAADARGIAEVHVASWRTTYRGIVPDDNLASLSVETRERRWASQLAGADAATGIYVAEAQDGAGAPRIVGFAAGGARRDGNSAYAGELYAVYLLQAAQGYGLGRRLAGAVADHLVRNGMRSMLVWVFEANRPARRFYETLGGVLLPERQYWDRAGVSLAEVSYGWADTGSLTAPS
jgi:GNAT superfamily N-acetyltransferase